MMLKINELVSTFLKIIFTFFTCIGIMVPTSNYYN